MSNVSPYIHHRDHAAVLHHGRRTHGSFLGMDIRMVQRSCDTLDSVAPPEVTIWSSVPSMSAKSRASPQMRPVETTT